MRIHHFKPVRALLVGALLFVASLGSVIAADAAAEAEAPKKRVVTDIVMEGDARCTRCHNDVSVASVEVAVAVH